MNNVEKEEASKAEGLNMAPDQLTDENLKEPVAAETEMEKLRSELADVKDKYLRQAAEFDNFRRRNAKERLELIQTAGREVIRGLLEVLDDCDRAQRQLEQAGDPAAQKEGILLVFSKLRSTLQAQGVKAMETLHTEFNPDLHEAITELDAPSAELRGRVIDEVVKGYYLNDKIIRHAKVVVGK